MTVITFLNSTLFRPLPALAALVVVLTAGSVQAAAKTPRKFFVSPEEAVQTLVAAAKSNDRKELLTILGPGSQPIVSSGDPVADKSGRERFVKLYEEKNAIEGAETGRALLTIGNEEYRFPVPIVKKGSSWYFDAKAGREELLNRRIGKNELEAIDVLHEYADAQREYASRDWNGDGVTEFARRFFSTPGKKDGLYWEAKEGEEESPFGALVATATQEGYAHSKNAKPSPFHGYYFKILTAQGKHAEGGAFDYVVNGKMILGFALVAYPAQYGASGVMTFIVNQNGIVYQKNLGSKTATVAKKMKRYDPDPSWKKVE
jgi:Protein of unknown function (DUF2950)